MDLHSKDVMHLLLDNVPFTKYLKQIHFFKEWLLCSCIGMNKE